MANTYYKYVDREVDSQVNWSEIGKSMTDMLKNEAKVREDKKAALDQATRDELKILADQPTGESESARAMAIKYGDNASQYLRMQDQLLKSGQLKLADYMVTRQNIVDDTDNLFGMLKNYQATYAEKMERYKNDENQAYELAAMERIEGFGNFSQAGAFIDPASGRVSMAMMDKKMVDGKEVYTMSDKPGKTASIATVKGLMQGKWNKFNTNGALDAIDASIGENIQTIRKIGSIKGAGEVMSVNDVLSSVRQEQVIYDEISKNSAALRSLEGKTDKKSVAARAKLEGEITAGYTEIESTKAIFSFMDFETNAINQNFTNEWNRLSVLTDSMGTAPDGNPYRFVYSKQEQEDDPVHNVYIAPSNDNNGSLKPVFTSEQEEASLEFMRNQLRGRYDYKESKQMVNDYNSPTYKPEYMSRNAEQKKIVEAGLEQWNNLRAGTLEEKEAAAKYFAGKDNNIATVRGTAGGGGIEFVYKDNSVVPYYFYDKRGREGGGELSGESWINVGNEMLGGGITEAQAKRFGRGAKTDHLDAEGKYQEETLRIDQGYQDGGLDYTKK